MSTKTTFKRVALVAVAALGLGVVAAVPSFAAASATTFTFTNGTAVTTTPKVGSVVKLPISAAQAGTADAIATGTLVATISTKPTNSTLATESTTVSIDSADGVTFSNAKITLESTSAVAGTSGAKITLTAAADATSAAAAPAALFSFTPDVAGYYVITFTKGGTGTTTFTANTVGVNVAGAALVQAATGLGKSSGTQINGRPSAAAFFLPAASTSSSRYEISATGAEITGIFALASKADAASATSSTDLTGITKKNGTSYAAGATYAGAATTTGAIAVASAVTDGFIVTTTSAVTASVVISVKSINVTTGELTAVSSATIAYAPAAAVVNPDSTSTSFISAGDVSSATADSATVSGVLTSGTIVATIITTQNAAGVAVSAAGRESITAVISGSGTLSTVGTAQSGRGITAMWNDVIKVKADGTSGVGTVTLTGATTGLVYKTVSVTFYDQKPATATVTVKKAYPAAGKTTTSAVFVTVKDSLGNVVKDASVALQPLTTGTGETTTACAYSATYSTNVCSVTGTSPVKFGPVSYKAFVTGSNTDATEIYSSAFTLTFADSVATKVAITAPATGSVGDKVTVTFTATEKNGYPVADSTYEGIEAINGKFWNTTTAPVYSSSSFAPFNAGETITTLSGVATKDLYLPAVSGTVTGTWTLAGTAGAGANSGPVDKTLLGSTIALSIAVSNPGVDAATDAANEATDAANAATDAALAAADAADAATAAAQDASDAVAALSATVAKLVASLKAQLTSLTNLVIKIQKKVRA